MNWIKRFLHWLVPGKVRKNVFWRTGKNVGMTLKQAQEQAVAAKCGACVRQFQWDKEHYVLNVFGVWMEYFEDGSCRVFEPSIADRVSSSWVVMNVLQ